MAPSNQPRNQIHTYPKTATAKCPYRQPDTTAAPSPHDTLTHTHTQDERVSSLHLRLLPRADIRTLQGCSHGHQDRQNKHCPAPSHCVTLSPVTVSPANNTDTVISVGHVALVSTNNTQFHKFMTCTMDRRLWSLNQKRSPR